MVKQKPRGKEIDSKILGYLGQMELTATTEMVAKAVEVGWYTAQMHLTRLKDEGKVKIYRIGRQNQWILTERIERMNKTPFK